MGTRGAVPPALICHAGPVPTLLLLRHAKTEEPHGDDHLRALTDRGRADAAAVGRWLHDQHLQPDLVVVSSATRARQTCAIALAGGPEPTVDDRLYDADVDDLRTVVAETPAQTACLLLVGHNPAMERLARSLDDDPEALAKLARGLPTSGLVVVEVDDWSSHTGRLLDVAVPRG